MKKFLLVVILFIIAPVVSFGQTPIEREIEQLGLKGASFTIAGKAEAPAAASKSATPSAAKFSVDFTHLDVSIEPNTEHDTNVTIHGWITNLTDEPLPLGFVRVQTLPKYWKTSVCFGINCYADFVSATVSQEPWAPKEARELVLHVRTPPGAQGIGEIELALYSPGTTDTVRVSYKTTMLDVPVVQCRTFWFDHPYTEGETKFEEVSVANPELFSVEVMTDTSYALYPKDVMAVRFCLNANDGKEHSTKVIFKTDKGTFERDLTLLAPTAGVRPSNDVTTGIRILSISPNPASASQEVQINLEGSRSTDLTFAIVDLLGREVNSSAARGTMGVFSQRLSTSDLVAGSYMVLVKEKGIVLDQIGFNIAR